MFVYACVLLLLFQNVNCDMIVETKVGKFKGIKADGDYHMYLGIPYAKIGNNPFAASIPYPPFNDTFEANDDSIICPQVNKLNDEIIGTIDCLRLNIYVPISRGINENVPVMVWIHGGGFETGFSGRDLYNPYYIVQHKVIVITINYRLGPYGFMCLDIPEVSGNQGLKDQYLAFKWIKENIQAFGGDINQITLFGQSAGGHSIDLHLMSATNILFNKVILQSGSAQALTVLYEPNKEAALVLAKYLGFKTNNISEALSHLSKEEPKTIISAAKTLKIQFKPCVETKYDGMQQFITRSWINAKVEKVKNMPVLMGFNELEYASLFFSKQEQFLRNCIVKEQIERVFVLDNQKLKGAVDFVTHFYFGDDKINKNVTWPLIRFLSDIIYTYPTHRTLKKYIEFKAKDIYFYMFSYVGGKNTVYTNTYDEYDDTKGHLCCAGHNDELYYLFKNPHDTNITSTDLTITEQLSTMWTNFAKYSNPTPKETELLPITWKPVKEDTYNYLDIDTKITLGKRPLHSRMAFWDLFYKHYKMSRKLYDGK